MYSGKEIKIEGETYILPPISLGLLRGGLVEKLKQHDELVKSQDYWGFQVLRGEILYSAFKRNYPDFGEEKFMNFLDMENTPNLWLYILGASGLVPGEIPAVTEKVVGTLDQSTDPLPQPTDGPTLK